MKTKWFIGAISASLGVTLLSSNTSHVDARGTSEKVIRVSLPHMSPAMAAMEDTFKDWTPRAELPGIKPFEVKLRAEHSSTSIMQMIRTPEPARAIAAKDWLIAVPIGGRLAMKLVPKALPVPLKQIEVAQLKGLTLRQTVFTPTPSAVKAEPIKRDAVDASPAQIRGVVGMLASQDWRQPSFKDRAETLIQKEVSERKAQGNTRQLGGIFVAGQPAATPPTNSGNLYSSQPGQGASPSRGAPALPIPSEPAATISWAKPDDKNHGQATLSGSIEIVSGLAITDKAQHIVIFRELEGLAIEKAQVWMNVGKFEVAARSLRGRLVGQLRGPKNEILGQGEINLSSLTPNADSTRIENLKMKISPVVDGARIDVVSAHSYGGHVETVPSAKVWMMGATQPLKPDADHRYFSEGGLQPGSSFVAQAIADNHWGTLVVGVSRQDTRAQLFPNKLIDALLNLTLGADRALADKSGVIWGRITKNGQPVTGARVEMAGDSRRAAVFFNSLLLPDRYADSTGENGAFAFVWATPGIQSVRVIYQGQSYPAQVIPVESNHVSYLEFDLGEPDSVPLEMVDPIDGSKEINAILRLAGDETAQVEVQGRGRLSLPAGPGLMMLEGDAGEQYELMRYSAPRNSKFMHLPVVRRDWLLSLAARRRINMDTEVGTVVGFAMNDDFIVRLEGADEGDAEPVIVYFDTQGQALFAEEGVAGGGFAIFNVPSGLRTVSISTKSSRQLFTQVVIAAPEVVNAVVK